MATVEHLIRKEDGSEVKIVAQDFISMGLKRSIGAYVLRRESPKSEWKLCNDRPHPDWRKMSVDEYVQHGRPEMLQVVSTAEILKVTSYLSEHGCALLYPE
jgi:hypothetical protein